MSDCCKGRETWPAASAGGHGGGGSWWFVSREGEGIERRGEGREGMGVTGRFRVSWLFSLRYSNVQ